MSDETNDPKKQAEEKAIQAIKIQNELQTLEQELANDPKFAEYIQRQKKATEQISTFWKELEAFMIDNNIKNVKGDWGSVTIAEKTNFDIDSDLLPAKYLKKTADVKLIGDTYKLTNKLPKGVTPRMIKYLTKRIK